MASYNNTHYRMLGCVTWYLSMATTRENVSRFLFSPYTDRALVNRVAVEARTRWSHFSSSVAILVFSERSGLKISVHLLFRLAFKSRRGGAEDDGEAVVSMDNLERSASLPILKTFQTEWLSVWPSVSVSESQRCFPSAVADDMLPSTLSCFSSSLKWDKIVGSLSHWWCLCLSSGLLLFRLW